MDYFNVSNSYPASFNPKPLQGTKGDTSVQNTAINPLTQSTMKDVVSFRSSSLQLMPNVNRFNNPQELTGVENRLLGSLDQLDALGVQNSIQNEVPIGLQNTLPFALAFSDVLVNRLENQSNTP